RRSTPPPQPRHAPGPPLSRPTATTTTREDTTTMSTPVQAAAEAVTEHIGTWEPVNAIDLDTFLSDLPGFFESLGAALARVADTLSEQHPVSPSVTDRLREIASTTSGWRKKPARLRMCTGLRTRRSWSG